MELELQSFEVKPSIYRDHDFRHPQPRRSGSGAFVVPAGKMGELTGRSIRFDLWIRLRSQQSLIPENYTDMLWVVN